MPALAYEAGRAGGSAPAWLNAANEVAVAAFLSGRIAWSAIAGSWRTPLSFTSRRTSSRWRTSWRPTRSPGRGPRGGRSPRAGRRDDPPGLQKRETCPDGRRFGRRRPRSRPIGRRPLGCSPLLRLAVVVVAGLVLAVVFDALPVLIVVLALVAMIMLHELGHFADREVERHEGDGVLLGLRAEAVVDTPGRDRVRRQGDPGRAAMSASWA